MAKRIRQSDIASASGVSVSTVSRVLSGAPGIRQRVRDEVFDVAASLGYPLPTSVVAGPSVLVLSSLDHLSAQAGQFHSDILEGVQDACRDVGAALSCAPLTGARDLDVLLEDVDAALLMSTADAAALARARALGVAVGLINVDDRDLDADVSVPDNEHGGWLATNHLLDLGHRDVVFLQHSERSTIGRRRAGWERALAARSCGPARARLLASPTTADGVAAALRSLREEGPITAVFCSNDVTAIAAMRVLARDGLRVPEDCAVVGFDDLPVAALSSPALSTVAIDRKRLGALALTRLLARLGEGEAAPVRTVLGTHFVRRGSCGSSTERTAKK